MKPAPPKGIRSHFQIRTPSIHVQLQHTGDETSGGRVDAAPQGVELLIPVDNCWSAGVCGDSGTLGMMGSHLQLQHTRDENNRASGQYLPTRFGNLTPPADC